MISVVAFIHGQESSISRSTHTATEPGNMQWGPRSNTSRLWFWDTFLTQQAIQKNRITIIQYSGKWAGFKKSMLSLPLGNFFRAILYVLHNSCAATTQQQKKTPNFCYVAGDLHYSSYYHENCEKWKLGRDHDFELSGQRIKQHRSVWKFLVHWKKGHTVHLPNDCKHKHSVPDLLQWLSACKVIRKSFLLAPIRCLHSLKYVQRCTWPSTAKRLRGSQPCSELPNSWDGCFAKLFFSLLLIPCQTVSGKDDIKCLAKQVTLPLSPLLSTPQGYGRKGNMKAWKQSLPCIFHS